MSLTITGIHHVGIPVSNLQRSIAFYRDVLGGELVFTADAAGPEVATMMDVPEAEVRLAMLRFGTTMIELLEYTHPRGTPYDRRNADVGASHAAFAVGDIAATMRQLEAQGVRFNAAPISVQQGPMAGYAFVYFADPDGIPLELVSAPAAAQPEPGQAS